MTAPPPAPVGGMAMLTLWVIYDHPSDMPEHWVVRSQAVFPGGAIVHGEACLADSLQEARDLVPAHMFRMEPTPDDPPAIHEVWI